MTSVHTTTHRRSRRATIGRPATTAALVVAIIVILVAAPQAQQAPPAFATTPSSTPLAASMVAVDAPMDVDLLVGRSTVLNVGSPIARVSLTVPDIADAMVTAPSQLLIHGKQPGTISLFVWDRAGAIKTFEVKVRRDLTPLVAHLKQLFPTENITVLGSGKDVVISGTVSSNYVIEKAADVAGGYVEKKENVVNLLQQQEGVASNQVMLRVRFAEVSRSAMTELGAALFTGPGGFHDYVARSTTQQFAAPSLEGTRESIQGVDKWGGGRDTVTTTGGEMQFSDFLNLFIFNNRYNVGTVVKALQERGLFQSLAEPNLIATNGKEASFLAGGEFPIPVVQGGSQGPSVTIIFKEFGVRLNFTPTVLGGDLINLKVRPEVSALDFNNAIVIEGFRVPALTSRRTETEVELRDGQTFAIAGLMNNSLQDAMRKIPGIGDIPILGWLFKSKAMQKSQTELVVLITPHIVRQGQMGVSEGLPSLVEPYLAPPDRTHPNPDPYVGSPRYPATQPAPRSDNTPVGQDTAPVASFGPHQTPSLNIVPLGGAQPPSHAPAVAQEPAARDAGTTAPAGVQSAAPVQRELPAGTPLTRDETRALERARQEEREAAAKAAAEDAKAAAAARKAQAAADEAQRADDKREAERRRADARAAEKRGAEEARKELELAKKAEEQRRLAERLADERQKREAEVARKNAADSRRQADDDQRRQQTLDDAALRLKAAQDAYQAEVAKSGGNR